MVYTICALRLDFVELQEKFADAETIVYWDVEDYFPVTGFVTFSERIRSALGKAGYHGKVSIRAYHGGGDKKPPEEEEAEGITFVSRATKRGRMHSMLLDMQLFATDNTSRAPTNLMVITKGLTWDKDEEETQLANCLTILNSECYNVLLAVPDDDYEDELKKMPFDLKYSAWLWKDLSAGGYPLDRGIIEACRRLPLMKYIEEDPCPSCGRESFYEYE
ncbi:unnamed protein product [Microthlaspi erraticum]|uniref:NYN domain-containing protein n=1 Tax=Microthlaspi erraticum TaxID=1685480 RepID=A0A6D2I2E4_9BRAS|nr:unnamed protein product [Microthlaspi erraticum]